MEDPTQAQRSTCQYQRSLHVPTFSYINNPHLLTPASNSNSNQTKTITKSMTHRKGLSTSWAVFAEIKMPP